MTTDTKIAQLAELGRAGGRQASGGGQLEGGVPASRSARRRLSAATAQAEALASPRALRMSAALWKYCTKSCASAAAQLTVRYAMPKA